MKARILPLDSDEHRLAQELLPWFVNGTLAAEEAAPVEAHLMQCARCQADAAAQAAWRALPIASEPAGDVDRGWRALRERLGTPVAGRSSMPGTTAGGWRLGAIFGATPGGWRRALPLVVAGQALVIVGLLFWFAAPAPAPYRTLGAAPPPGDANAVAVFRADATEPQMRASLRAADARIVGGPTATDAYLLHLGRADAQAVARLRAQPGVQSVESLQGEPAR